MKSDTSSHLKLVSKKASPSKDYLVEALNQDDESLEKALISLIEARATGKINPATIDAIALTLQTAKCPQTVVQRSLDVSILLSNADGDGSICFKYDLANFGHKPLPGRTHRFWFTYPQRSVDIFVSTESGIPLEVESIDSSESFKEVRICFPKELEMADQISYRIQYQVKKEFINPAYYDIVAWTLTNKISVTLIAPEQYRFNDTSTKLESADGFISDSPPSISLINEYGRDKLTWQYRSAKAGDRFRTRWSLD